MRIRIGNDIKLKLQLVVSGDEPANILSAKAFVINKTAKLQAIKDLENKTRFLNRFPAGSQVVDPKLNGLQPSEYNINMLGEVPYNTYPKTHTAKKGGFGVEPNWDKKYTPIVKNYDVASYKADVKFTEDRNVVEVNFPATAQLYTGEYNVILVSKIYKPGYNDNAATVTVDYSDIFTLVGENEPGETGAVVIEKTQTYLPGDPSYAEDPEPVDPEDPEEDQDIYVDSASYTNSVLNLHRTDGTDVSVNIASSNYWEDHEEE